MTARPANTARKPAKRAPAKKVAAPAEKAPAATETAPDPPKKTAGQRVFDELEKDRDSFSVRMMIEQLADLADINEKLRRLTSGDLSEWTSLRLGPQVVSVSIDDPIRRRKEISTEMRQLLAEIHRQRADLPIDPDDNDDPAKKY